MGTQLASFKNAANVHSSFGASVDVSGTTAIVGELGTGTARAYLLAQTAEGWAASAALKGSHISSNDLFGASVAISGSTVVIGSSSHAGNNGRAYVYSTTSKG